MARPITFLSDYGLDDTSVGVCHAVIAKLAPDARVVDLTHSVPRHDVRTGALVLRRTLRYAAPGVHIAIVDPERGRERRALALRCSEEDRILVGPDNGLLWLAAQWFGGISEVADIARSPMRLQPNSATSHGRDLFAPVAANLALGAAIADTGDLIEPGEVTKLQMPLARIEEDAVVTHAIGFDHYGNVSLDVEHEELSSSGLLLGHPLTINGRDAVYAVTYADVDPGVLILYQDAYETAAVAVNRGSAKELLGLDIDSEVLLAPA
ncbi:MAG TPA: SAM-dependent chlorinase/fluorinase [Baekduia sp.]|nr:SAM-dependent chlorinase/fluorinase [Baekduia sp.]